MEEEEEEEGKENGGKEGRFGVAVADEKLIKSN